MLFTVTITSLRGSEVLVCHARGKQSRVLSQIFLMVFRWCILMTFRLAPDEAHICGFWVKHLDNYWMHYHKISCRHSCPFQDYIVLTLMILWPFILCYHRAQNLFCPPHRFMISYLQNHSWHSYHPQLHFVFNANKQILHASTWKIYFKPGMSHLVQIHLGINTFEPCFLLLSSSIDQSSITVGMSWWLWGLDNTRHTTGPGATHGTS